MTLLMISIYAAPGYAGSRNRNLVKGIVIGTGAVILGTALVNGLHNDNRVRVVVSNRQGYRSDCRKCWAAPRYERRWNPGHYNRRGQWINGRYVRVPVGPKFCKNR